MPSASESPESPGVLGVPGVPGYPWYPGATSSLCLQTLQNSSGVPGLLLSRQVSLYVRPQMHLFAILENSTLRLD